MSIPTLTCARAGVTGESSSANTMGNQRMVLPPDRGTVEGGRLFDGGPFRPPRPAGHGLFISTIVGVGALQVRLLARPSRLARTRGDPGSLRGPLTGATRPHLIRHQAAALPALISRWGSND